MRLVPILLAAIILAGGLGLLAHAPRPAGPAPTVDRSNADLIRPLTSGISVGNMTTGVFGGGSSFHVSLTVGPQSGIVVFASVSTVSNPIGTISDGTDTWESVSGSNQIAAHNMESAVWATYRASDSASNVPAGTRTITVTTSGAVSEMTILAVEVVGSGANGYIYYDTSTYGVTNFGPASSISATTLAGGLQGQPLFHNNPAELSLMFVQETANRTMTPSGGTVLANQLNQSGIQFLSVVELPSPATFHNRLAETFTYGANVNGNGYVVSLYSISPLPAPAAYSGAPAVQESESVYANGAISGTTVTYAPIYATSVPAKAVLAVFIAIDQSGSKGNASTSVTDSLGDNWTDQGRAKSNDSASLPSNVLYVWTTISSGGNDVIKANVTWNAPSPFYSPGGSDFDFLEVVGGTGVAVDSFAGHGGKTGIGGSSVSLAPTGNSVFLSLAGASIDSQAAAGDTITFTPSGGFAGVDDASRSASFFLQPASVGSSTSLHAGLNWTNATSSDTWAMGGLVLGPLPPPPTLACGQSVAGAGPVAPDLGDPVTLKAVNSATLQRNAYIETIKDEMCLTSFWVSGTPEIYYANVTPILTLASDIASESQAQVTPVLNETWINASAKCQAFYCFPNETLCDASTVWGQLPPSRLFNDPCQIAGVEYSGPLPLGRTSQYVNVTVTRVYEFLVQPSAYWFQPNSHEEATAMNLSILTAAQYDMTFGYVGANGVNNKTFLTAWVTLAAPYPKGTWDASETQIRYYSNSSQTVTIFDQTLTDIVVSWRYIAVIQNLTIALFGFPAGTFGNGNASTPSQITLALLNVTQLPGGFLEATATWTNLNAGTFTGSINCVGPWTASAIDTNASVDASLVLSVYTVSAVDILTGQVNVTNQTTITVSVTYAQGSSYSPTGPVAFLNGLPINWVEILLAVAVALAIASYATRKRGKEGQAFMAAAGIVMLGVVGSLWLVV